MLNVKFKVGQSVVCTFGLNKGKGFIIKAIIKNGYSCMSVNTNDTKYYGYNDKTIVPQDQYIMEKLSSGINDLKAWHYKEVERIIKEGKFTIDEVINAVIKKMNKNKSKKPSFSFEGMNITNPYMDETGRFEVNPKEYYGLTDEDLKKFDK